MRRMAMAEQPNAARHASADIKPCHQSRTEHRRNRQHDQYELRGADLPAGVSGNLARLEALLLRQLVDGALELGCVGLRGIESQLGIALLTELVGARGHDSVIRADGAKLLVKRQQLVLLCLVANRVQVLDDFSLRRADQVAQRLHAAGLAHQRGFDQKPGEKICFRLGLAKPAQQVEPPSIAAAPSCLAFIMRSKLASSIAGARPMSSASCAARTDEAR